MITLLLLLVAGVRPNLPHWKTKFVPTEHVGTHLTILDCTKKLSLVGYGYSLMIDVIPCTPVAVLRGRDVSQKEPEKDRIWGFKVTKGGFLAAIAEYPEFDRGPQSKPWRPKIIETDGRRNWSVTSGDVMLDQVDLRAGLEPSTSESFSDFPTALKPEINRRKERLYDPGLSVQWIVKAKSFSLGNGNYQPVSKSNPDMRLHDSDRTIAVVKYQGQVLPLADFVDSSGLVIDDIVWFSPEGWFVCRGSAETNFGLIWVFPS